MEVTRTGMCLFFFPNRLWFSTDGDTVQCFSSSGCFRVQSFGGSGVMVPGSRTQRFKFGLILSSLFVSLYLCLGFLFSSVHGFS